MPAGNRSNPLALAVLVSLLEEPLHPYEIATRLRARKKHESVRLNYGSLYAVVASLQRRGLIAPRETEREGRLPERTIYEITAAGRAEAHDWLSDLISTPVKDYPAFEAALSFLPALPPEEATALLWARVQSLELEAARDAAVRRLMDEREFPRLFWVEGEFRMALRAAELEYVRKLAEDIESGTFDGLEWWRDAYRPNGSTVYTRGARP